MATTRIPYAFAATGDTTTVEDESTGTEMSWESGWSSAYELADTDAGYRYVDRGQHNYLWNALSGNIKQWQDSLYPEFFTEKTEGYDQGFVVSVDGVNYISKVDENTDAVTADTWQEYKGEIAPNKIAVSQLVVEGNTGDALPENGVTTSYSDGAEVALGWFADGAVTNLTKDTYGNVILETPASDTGVIYTEFYIGENLSLSDLFYSVMPWNSTDSQYDQTYGDGTNGITLTEPTSGTARLTIDLTVLTGGFVVAGSSEFAGRLDTLSLGRVTKTHVITSSQTFTKNPFSQSADVTIKGGGGGSGGVDGQGSGTAAASPGAAEGGISIKHIENLESSYSIVIGGAGSAGSATTTGTAGGDTTFIGDETGDTSMTAYGGNGSQSVTASSSSFSRTAATGGIATGGDLNIKGCDGFATAVIGGDIASFGNGGGAYLGGITRAVVVSSGTVGAGRSPDSGSYGCAASGAAVWDASANAIGANGVQGVCIIKEHF